MERRAYKRHPASVRTEVIYQDHILHGIIEDFSASGARLLIDQIEHAEDFRKYDPLELKFSSPSGKESIMKCTIMWASYIPPTNTRCQIGLELADQSYDAIGQFL